MLGVQHNLAFIVEDAALHLPLPRNRPSFWPRQIEKSPVERTNDLAVAALLI